MKTIEVAEKILPVYLAIQRAHGKDYSFPSQLTILQKLLKYRGIKKSKATLCRWLRRLQDEGYLNRIRRIKRDPVRGMIFKSTICQIKLKGYHVLRRLGIPVWKEIKNLLAKLKEIFPSMKKAVKDPQDPRPGKEKVEAIIGGLVNKLSV